MKLTLSLAALVALLFVASLLIGPAAFGPLEALSALLRGEGEATVLVMREIRLPRAILGLLTGASLGLAGAAMQGWLRNPLAEPGLIGVSPMASLGAVLALQSGLVAAFAPALPLAALAGAALAVVLLFVLSGPRGGTLTVILAGVALSALAGALMSLVLNLSPNPFAASEIIFWLMGSLADRSMEHVWLAAPVMAAGALALAGAGRGLDALSLGEDVARSLGISPEGLRRRVVFGVAALAGAATSVAGGIGFVGLVVPHLLRRATGGRPSALLLPSALGGAAVILAADLATRLILPERDLKLGVLTALIGAPFFIHMILSLRKATQ
ncbi:FecCD family ABC transporter permease [Falsigemmobacter faecalis]|uniref:Iron ABC transporter permease n=1 Tax=Falsigemmobacter faecalis TaxID=2488730 RepID=A0A3P3DE89_9RHOB|nr:iron ABC transporter permease [Falsigemmobacter faecalis]RRH72625.1 iron ABC transporter permease [Falsigemmobacter faecalis]